MADSQNQDILFENDEDNAAVTHAEFSETGKCAHMRQK